MSQLDELIGIGQSDFKRDRWGRPLIMQLDGKRTPYTRASSATKAIDDTWNLDQWDRRNVSYGMAHDASLVARVLAIGGDPSTWSQDDKKAIAKIVDDARTVAKAHKGADIGTAVHRIIERRNRGEQVAAGPYQADVDAYYRALEAAGIDILEDYLEVRLVCDELGLAGSADNIVGYAGAHRIGDLKTGATVSYGALGFAGQLAAYANGALYDVDNECRLPTPELDLELGFIIHLPAGEGRCDIYEIDLAKGYRAAKVAYQARAAQKASKSWLVHHTSADTKDAAQPVPPAGGGIALSSPAANEEEPPSSISSTSTTPPERLSSTSTIPTTLAFSTGKSVDVPSSSSPESSMPIFSSTSQTRTPSSTSKVSRTDVVARVKTLVDAGHGLALATIWPDNTPGFKGTHQHTELELRAIYQAVCEVEDEHGLSPGFTAADCTLETAPSWDEQRRTAAIVRARLAWDAYWEPDVMTDILCDVMQCTIIASVDEAFKILNIFEAERLAAMADSLNDGAALEYNGHRWVITQPKEHAT